MVRNTWLTLWHSDVIVLAQACEVSIKLVMKPPIFVWKSGTLDFCDVVGDFEDRYPPTELAHEGVVACDSQGRALWISRVTEGAVVNVAEESQAEAPGLLRSILWRYLEGRGASPEEIQSLSLDELVERVCPKDPMGEYRQTAKLQGCFAVIVVVVIACAAFALIDWMFGTNWFSG